MEWNSKSFSVKTEFCKHAVVVFAENCAETAKISAVYQFFPDILSILKNENINNICKQGALIFLNSWEREEKT